MKNYKKKYIEEKNRYLALKSQQLYLQFGGKPENNKNKFIMFTDKERHNIMKDYNNIVEGDKDCMKYPLNKVMDAAKGMYIYPKEVLKKKGKKELCNQIKESYMEKANPIVHEDSLTAWGNHGVEKYGLEIKDIMAMEPGEKMEVILFDRNIGDYLYGTDKGTKYDPKKKGLMKATYIHAEELTGILIMHDVGVVHKCFEWEINSIAIDGSFWGPINSASKKKDKIDIRKLDPNTKVGWRGPAIRLEDAKKYLPNKVKHYNTWYDDYMPFRHKNYLKLKKK